MFNHFLLLGWSLSFSLTIFASMESRADSPLSPAPSRHYLTSDTSLFVLDRLVSKHDIRQSSPVSANRVPPEKAPKLSVSPESPPLSWESIAPPNASMETTSIAELQALASEHNPTLKILRQKIGAAQGNWIQAGLKPNPTLAYEAEEMGDGGKAGKHGFVVEQEIVTAGKRKRERTAAAWEKEELRRRWQLQVYSIQNDVRARAYEVLAAQRIVAINRRLTQIGDQSVQAAEELGRVGEVSRIELLQIRAKANEARASLATALDEETLAWKKLAVMIGLREFEPRRITDPFDCHAPVDREAVWQMIRQGSPRISAAQAKIQQARALFAREQAGRIPDVTIGGGVHYDTGERQTLGSFNVGLPLRVFDRNQGNIMKARSEWAAACREMDRLVLTLYETFSEYYASLDIAQKQIHLYKEKIIPDVQEALELSLQGYRSGEYGYMEVLAAQQLFLESQTQFIQAQKAYALACVYLDGFLAQGGLEEVEN